MAKIKRLKRNASAKYKHQTPKKTAHIKKNRYTSQIVRLLYSSSQPLTLNTVTNKLATLKEEKKHIIDKLYTLVEQGVLQKNKGKQFALSDRQMIFEGQLERHQKGFGFVTGLTSQTHTPVQNDVFVSKHNLAGAEHGDRVLVRLSRQKNDRRRSGQILSILKRAAEHIPGFYHRENGQNLVIPEDHRYPYVVDVGNDIPDNLTEGDAVIITVPETRPGSACNRGNIIKVLGSPASIEVQMQLVIEKFQLPHIFSSEVLAEADALVDEVPLQHREDLRDLLHVTIDGETAKDFDDAVCVIKTRKGFRLYVSIADVSHFVTPGSELDKEAYKRGTSIYFPGRVIPMLPERLSNHLCSLIPDRDRLAFTAILDFDRQGNLKKKRFCKSIIKSHQRFTYTTVQQIIIDKNPEVRKAHKPFLTPLKWAMELAEQLQMRRLERGSLGFTIPEPDIKLQRNGKIASIERMNRIFAHQIIEEFMLAANEAVASFFTETATPTLYRIHEQPATEKVKEFISFAKSLAITLPKSDISPAWFAKILSSIKGSPKEYIFNTVLLRTMQQAKYSPVNQGHFGLAATNYTHFTSPIRRYPDLHVHRVLSALLQQKKQGTTTRSEKSIKLQQIGQLLSQKERTAIDAEREMHDRLKIAFMEQFIGETFEAIVSGVSQSVLFIELLSPFVSGSIGIEELQDDYYICDSKNYRLIGDVGLKIYQIGDLLTAKLINVNKVRRRLNFTLAEKTE